MIRSYNSLGVDLSLDQRRLQADSVRYALLSINNVCRERQLSMSERFQLEINTFIQKQRDSISERHSFVAFFFNDSSKKAIEVAIKLHSAVQGSVQCLPFTEDEFEIMTKGELGDIYSKYRKLVPGDFVSDLEAQKADEDVVAAEVLSNAISFS